MPRPKRQRKMNLPPAMLGFKPFGTPLRELDATELLFEEFEAIRLADYEDLNQEEAAKIMGVSRPTFTRIYEKARKTVAKALAESKVILIVGGHVKFDEDWYKCYDCKETFVKSNIGQSNCGHCDSNDIAKVGEGFVNEKTTHHQKGKLCYCSDCGIELTHKQGIPCYSINCPYCNQKLTGIKLKPASSF
ncbi:MAG: DUF134 domain-containing protein [Bacteroidota bacterium]|nr:DUF134 domain-containing protein [Bacteroidota bacterium]